MNKPEDRIDNAKVELMIKRRKLLREGKYEEAAEILRIVNEEMGGMTYIDSIALIGT